MLFLSILIFFFFNFIHFCLLLQLKNNVFFFSWNSFNSYSCASHELTTSICKNWSLAFIVATLLLSHISVHIIHLFSTLFLNFYSLHSLIYIKKKIKKKKNLFFCLLVHIYYYTSFNLYPPSYLFVSPLLSILYLCLPTSVTYCYTFFIIFSFLYFDYSSSYYILYKFNIISPIQFIFSPQKILSSLSLSLSLSFLVDFFFLIILFKVDGFFYGFFFFNMCFGIMFF